MMNSKHILSRGHRAARVSTNACGKTGFAMRFIISLLLLVTTGASSTWAQGTNPVKSIEATFNNPNGNTNWANVAVTPHALGANGVAANGVSITVTGTAALKNPQNALTNEFLGPNHQTGGGSPATHTYTFRINGLPTGSMFNKIALPLKGVNSGGNNQGAGTKHVNVIIVVKDGTTEVYRTNLTDKSLTTGTVGEVHENLSVTMPEAKTINSGTMEVAFTISKGTDNAGCFMAFHGLNITAIDRLKDNVRLRFVNRAGIAYSGDTKLVRYTPAGGGSNVEFAATNTQYSFGNVLFDKANFSGINGYVLDNVALTEADGQQTLTFTVDADPNGFQFSDAPTSTGEWATNTRWFTIHNNRNAKGYLSTQDAGQYLDGDGNLTIKNGANASGNRGGLWAFVQNGSGFNIYNNAYGPDFILGVTGSGSGARMKMYPKDDVPSNVSTLFAYGENNQRDGSASHAYYFQIGTSGNNHINEQSGYPGLWDSGNKVSDGGSAFTITNIPASQIEALPKYDVYKIYWSVSPVSPFSISYKLTQNVFGKRGTVNHGDYLIVAHESATTVADFNATANVDYSLADVRTKEIAGHSYKSLVFVIEDQKATEYWTVRVTDGYTANYNGLSYANGEIFSLRPGASIKHVDFNIEGPSLNTKFVWGPVVNKISQTVTYEVRDLTTVFTSGWYQMQIADSEVAALRDKIKSEEGNINTQANTLYLASATYEPGEVNGSPRIMKVSGVPQYAGEASTYVYIKKNAGANSYSLISQSTGKELTGNFTFNNGVLTKSGAWSYESTAHPLEGPYLLETGNGNPSFKLAEANLSDYIVYKVTIKEGETENADVRLNISNPDVLGSKVVTNGGYLFLRKETNAPLASQFSVSAGNVRILNLSVGDETDGVKPITIHVDVKQTWWKVQITGDAKSGADRVIYNDREFQHNESMPLPEGYEPTALDFKTNVTDRFVWGPIIDKAKQTVTFEVRTPATDLEAGSWYQLQLSPTAEGTFYNSNARTGNLVEGTLGMNPRNAGSQIYITGANKTSNWTVELMGMPNDESVTYLFVNSRSGNTTQMMMQNGYYIGNSSQASASAANTNIEFITTNNEFFWRDKVFPWANLNGIPAALGMASGGTPCLKLIAHKAPVKAYKVVLSSGTGTLVYKGDAEIIGSNRVANGYFIFAKADQSLETDISKYELRGVDGSISSISANTSNGITTLTVNVTTPTYDHVIIHKQNRYYDYLETDPNKPDDGFIQDGEGWNVRTGSSGEIREQNTSVFEIPVYLKQGTSMASYLPTNQLASYQRWYNWDTDGQVDTNVLISSLSGYTQFNNGYAYFEGIRNGDNTAKGPTLRLPAEMTEYNVGLDISRMTDYSTNVSGTSGSAIEPTLGMRIVYQVRDAKKIANDIKNASDGGDFFEVHNISLPNVQYGSRTSRLQDRTLSTTLPLNMDLNNYWGFNNGGTGNDNLVQLTQDSQLRVVVEGGNAPIQNVMMIPGSGSAASGNISRTGFNTGHFVLFQYPDNGYIEPNATATINVYMKSGTVEYKLAQFNLTFIGNAHPVVVTELKGTYRHPDALSTEFGAPVTELTFDETPNSEYSTTEAGVIYPDYRYPLDYKGASYAFGARNNRNWAASRGEYALTSISGSSQQTGTPRIAYYPVTNYLRSMKDPSFAFGSKIDGAYQLYIDAADQPGKIASIELRDALCAGSRLYCYGYIGCTSGGTGQHPTSVLINVMGTNKTTHKEELIYSYCPGIITLRGYAEDGRTIYSTAMGSSSSYSTRDGAEDRNYWAPWQQIGFSFAIGADVAAKMEGYSIQIMNNAYNSNGGDTMLDDFQIFVKKPGAEVANTTPLCSDQIRHIKVITEYETLLEAVGEDSNHDGMMNVGFCFLDKEVYDRVLEENADKDAEHGYARTSHDNKYNKAFGEALMGNRTLDKTNKDHAFHNFNIIRDGEISTIEGETKQHFYTDIPQYSFKESVDDKVYRDSIRGERYIVFKESVAHGEASGIENHKWTAGKAYYLLFSTVAISEEHVALGDLGCTVFNLDDNKCSVLHEFTVAPPVIIKGDATHITSGDEVQACDGQVATLAVDLNGRTETKDVIIKNLTYDWWTGYVSHKTMAMENDVPRDYDSNGHAIIDPNEPDKAYNTMPATLLNYKNVWWGTYKQRNEHLDKNVGDKIYLKDALLEFRRAYPNATDLVGVKPIHKSGDTVEYELTQDMIDCIAHFLQTELESGMTPLILAKKEVNLSLTADKADKDGVYHFVVIPIAPNIYSVDEDAIYCPDPQELKVKITSKAPSLANGFHGMPYPATMHNVPIRVGLQQLNAVRHRNEGTQNTLTVPLRNAKFAYPEIGKTLQKTSDDAEFWMVSTDDPAYKSHDKIEQDFKDNYISADEDLDEMLIIAGQVKELAVTPTQENPSMQIIFNNNVIFREGYTYTMKVKYHEMKDANGTRDEACEGSFVFDIKVVPEYQVWTGRTMNSDWTNDSNWARADRNELLAANGTATGDGMTGATSLNDETSYETNEKNTTASSFVPMYFTNVLINQNDSAMVELYKDGFIAPNRSQNQFLAGMKSTATKDIVYDLSVKPVSVTDRNYTYAYDCDYDCELFDTYIANGVTFTPGAQMGNTHYLKYNKAWVEYELKADRWYTLGSPLKKSVAGDWYSPTAGGKQKTPHFYEINYKPELNDRFRPAYYQRSWDRDGNNVVYEKNNDTYNSYVRADWSYVYNDAAVDYSAGGFSVKAELDYMNDGVRIDAVHPANDSVLVRMPKADTSYKYFAVDGSTGQAADALIVAAPNTSRADIGSYRLMSDDLGSTGSGAIQKTVANKTTDNNFLLLHNPFMAAMDMDAFFAENTDLEAKYWIVEADKQMVSVKTAADGQWISNISDGANGQYVAPLQGFFVKKKENGSAPQNAITAIYKANMQTVVLPDKEHNVPALRTRATDTGVDLIRLIAERNGATSTAMIMLGENFSDGYMDGEDCETFVDGNLYDKPTVYTSAGMMAQTINVRKSLDMVPVGVISSDDSEVVLSFDLSHCSHNTLYLYDDENGSFTEIYDGAKILMSGNNAGRYYLASSMDLLGKLDSIDNSSSKGIWTPSGVYCGESIDGLTPGLYIIDGVKMLIRGK